MKISGHVYKYMVEWGNLYKYSQQEWESLNSLIKRFFFLCTNKGGGRHSTRTRLIPIACLFQRRILWMSGLAEIFLDALKRETVKVVMMMTIILKISYMMCEFHNNLYLLVLLHYLIL